MVAPAMVFPSLYHWLPFVKLELNVIVTPLQKVVAPLAEITAGDGTAITVTVIAFDSGDEHPFDITIQVYVPALVAVNVCAVATVMAIPSLYHWLPFTMFELSTTPVPEHIAVFPPAVITGAEEERFTVTCIELDTAEKHPPAVTIVV